MGSPRKQEETQQQGAHQQQQQQREKMCGPPCFRSVCGMPLQKAVYIIGLIELIITVIVTIANVVKYSQFVNEEDCEGKDVCIPHHQVLCLRRLLRHPLFCSPVHRSENETPVPSHILDSHHSRLQHQVPLRLLRQRLDELGGLGVHLLPGLLHRRHLGGRRLHQGVRHHQRRCCPRLWCPASLQGLRRSFTISVTICHQTCLPKFSE